jgi:hypothetical protein
MNQKLKVYFLVLAFASCSFADNLFWTKLNSQIGLGAVQGLHLQSRQFENPSPTVLVGFSSPYWQNDLLRVTIEAQGRFTRLVPTHNDFNLYWAEARGGWGFYLNHLNNLGFGADLALDIVKAPKAPAEYQFSSAETDYGTVIWLQSPPILWGKTQLSARADWHMALTLPQTSHFISLFLMCEFGVF